MKDATKYVRAAKRIVSGENRVCCAALTWERQNLKSFRELFQPRHYSDTAMWFGMPNEENQLARSLALLFMAEISKEEI